MKDNLQVEQYDLEKINLYDGLVDTFKKCLKGEIQNLLKEAREEIYYTQQYIKALKQETKNIYKDCVEMAEQLHELENNG